MTLCAPGAPLLAGQPPSPKGKRQPGALQPKTTMTITEQLAAAELALAEVRRAIADNRQAKIAARQAIDAANAALAAAHVMMTPHARRDLREWELEAEVARLTRLANASP